MTSDPTRDEVERPTLDALIDLIGELGRQAYYLLDDCETSGDVGAEVHAITSEGLADVSGVLDRIEALPFEEPGCILGVGAMLQAALKQTIAAENAALRGRLEATEASRFRVVTERNALEAQLTEARATLEAAEAEQDELRDAYIGGQCSHGESLIEIEELRRELTASRARRCRRVDAHCRAVARSKLQGGQEP